MCWCHTCHSPPSTGSISEVSSFLTFHKLLLNKGEMENLYYHYPAPGGCVALSDFLADIGTEAGGNDPVWLEIPAESPYTAHLALSGVSHLEFGVQYKPFPAHWGTPPNAQMKGHNGIMRDLPGGYGKGNAPMAHWVRENMVADKNNGTNERGQKPYPFGNYSLGAVGF